MSTSFQVKMPHCWKSLTAAQFNWPNLSHILCCCSNIKKIISSIQAFLLLDFSPTVNAATLIFISGCGSAISSAKEGKSGFIYNLVKS